MAFEVAAHEIAAAIIRVRQLADDLGARRLGPLVERNFLSVPFAADRAYH
jgi:ATP-dependent protease HslVU (ClpYQ) ATPase subunit